MKPYLIQRGKIRLGKFDGIDSLVNFEYMGSAEFEFGALGKALKGICSLQLDYYDTPHSAGGRKLWLLTPNQLVTPVRAFWNIALSGVHQRLKEPLWYGKFGDGTDFWWDIDNHWIAALGDDRIVWVAEALALVKKKKGW